MVVSLDFLVRGVLYEKDLSDVREVVERASGLGIELI